jgi:putative hydrolase of the HAD superfamily
MILIFDLDDTLYDEVSFVISGFRAVAEYGREMFKWDNVESLDFLIKTLEIEGRGRVFNRWLEAHGRMSKANVNDALRVYRHHTPTIEMFPAARRVLDLYRERVPLYLVTDGHKIVQKNKVLALNIWNDFRRIFITHRYGIRNAKPSTHCFNLIRQAEGCEWENMIYVGDNPHKDFVNLKSLGALTVRVKTGPYRNLSVPESHDAQISIENLEALPLILSSYS